MKQGPPQLTVVTVVRNDPEALRLTLGSLREQDLGDIEHLIVDGASTDGTGQVAAGAAADYGARVISEPDRGVYDAMNKGISLARGSHVQFLNAGDTYTSSGELAWALAQLRTGTAWLRTRVRFVDEDRSPTRPLAPAAVAFTDFAWGRQPVFHQGAFMAQRLLSDLGGFDTDLTIAADFDLSLRALAGGVTPQISDRVTVDVDAAGLSTEEWRKSLWQMHRSRTSDPINLPRGRSWSATAGKTLETGVRRGIRKTADSVLGQERVSRWRTKGDRD
jgi:GT2 family glycosyltransferase